MEMTTQMLLEGVKLNKNERPNQSEPPEKMLMRSKFP